MLTKFIPAAFKPWAKAINAFGSGLAIFVTHGLIAKEWDLTALEALITGGLIAGVVFATPNE